MASEKGRRPGALMKKLLPLIALTFGLSAAGPAFAADLPTAPVYKAPAVAPAYNWTGLYVNGGAGYGMWSGNTTTLDPGTGVCDLCVNQIQGGRGFLGTIGAGFDYQFSDHIVAGIFGDGDFSGMRGTIQDQNPFYAGTINENWSWAAGGRLGWLITPELLAYAKVGFTQTHFNGTAMQDTGAGAYVGFSTPGFTTDGWFIGGGVESMFAPGWFWRTEYRVANYGARDIADASDVGSVDDIRFHPIVQTVTSGLVYKFNWPGMAPPALPSLASLPIFQAFAPASVTPWTGIYVNAGVGYGMWTANTTTLEAGTGFCHLCLNQMQGGRGISGTIGAGFDYQFSDHIVAGVFGDFDPSGIKGTIQDQNPFFAGTINENWSWAAGARLGWLVMPEILSYTNAGFTQARFGGAQMVYTFDDSATGDSTSGFTTDGWFLGGGVEAMFAPGWFLRAEYRWAGYGAHDIADTSPTDIEDDIRFRPVVQTATAELVYKFNWTAPAPVVAKY